jgi:hypothetical protein
LKTSRHHRHDGCADLVQSFVLLESNSKFDENEKVALQIVGSGAAVGIHRRMGVA